MDPTQSKFGLCRETCSSPRCGGERISSDIRIKCPADEARAIFTSCDSRGSEEVLAIIPARGGSKGIPRKNISPVGGKPLVAYTIETALAAKNVDRVIVSTDDEEIADIAKEYGAEVPFLRPVELAGDSCEIMDALRDCRSRLLEKEGYLPSIQIVMYPTHPFRKQSTVEGLVDILSDGCSQVCTVREIIPGPLGLLTEEDGAVRPLSDGGRLTAGRRYFRRYGYFYGMRLDFAPGMYAHVLRDEMELIDIDNWQDLALADCVAKMKLFDFTE